jgi:hypothetical protein
MVRRISSSARRASPVPLLQAQDGTFYGTDNTYNKMIHFDQSGNTIWSVPNDYPQIATADGGVIGALGITYDNQGRANGQIANLPVQSWTGNGYQYGSTEQVVPTPTNMATTLWAQVGANPSGQSTAARPWYFKLIWQNDFTFTPENPQNLPNLTTNITYDATIIKQAALQAFKDAYSGVPVNVSEGTPDTGDARVTVLDHPTLPNAGRYGATDTNFDISQVDYINNMLDGQFVYNIVINNAQGEAKALQKRTDYVQAIGRAIGNTAAHEIAHQFLVQCCDMDADPTEDPNARGTFNSVGNGPFKDPSFWTGYWPNPIIYLHWEAPALTGLGQCLGRGWRPFNGSPCHN